MIVNASGQSQIAAPPGVPGVDKIGHFLVFGLLGSLVVRSPGWRRAWPLCAVVLVSLFGISDEFHQSFTPGREVEFADWMADTLGAGLAVTLYVNWSAYRRILEWRLPVPWRSVKPAALAPAAAQASLTADTHS
jgi:VanZ family protein